MAADNKKRHETNYWVHTAGKKEIKWGKREREREREREILLNFLSPMVMAIAFKRSPAFLKS